MPRPKPILVAPMALIVRDGRQAFRWEIRAYGCGLALKTGSDTFASELEARRDGRQALAQWLAGENGKSYRVISATEEGLQTRP